MTIPEQLEEEAVEAGLTVGYIRPVLCRICNEEEYTIQLRAPDGMLWAEGSSENIDGVREHFKSWERWKAGERW